MSTLQSPQNKIQYRGFTLIETLVAIAIVSISLIVPLYAIQQSLNVANAARDQLSATMLAQEAVEYVRSVRDDNFLTGYAPAGPFPSWLYGVDGTTYQSTGSPDCFASDCTVDSSQLAIAICPSSGCAPLSISSTNLYTQVTNGTTPTRFTRRIRLSPVSGSTNKEVMLVVTVTWISNHIPYTAKVVEYLYNWL